MIYMAMLGKEGLRDVARHCHAKSEYLKSRITFATILNNGPTFNEFAIRLPKNAEKVVAGMAARGFLAGIPLAPLGVGAETDLLIAVTERRTRADLDAFAKALEEVSCS